MTGSGDCQNAGGIAGRAAVTAAPRLPRPSSLRNPRRPKSDMRDPRGSNAFRALAVEVHAVGTVGEPKTLAIVLVSLVESNRHGILASFEMLRQRQDVLRRVPVPRRVAAQHKEHGYARNRLRMHSR